MIREFANPLALAEALAADTAQAIRGRLRQAPEAAIALSGGETPAKFMQALSRQDLPWRNILVTLVDDRWVDPGSPRSNARLVREHLLHHAAAAARFVPLVNDASVPEEGREAAERAIAALPRPFAAVILGMGTDGHIASFFPGGDRLAQALHPAGQLVETMRAAAAIEPRITLTLPVILGAEMVALHIEGAEKRKVLEAALQDGPPEILPVRAVLARKPAPDIFWCP